MVKDDMIIMCGPPFIKYNIAQFNGVVRGPMDEAVGAVHKSLATNHLELRDIWLISAEELRSDEVEGMG